MPVAVPLLLQKSGIKEGKGYGGFPVSGLFLRNTHEATAQKHNARSTARHPWAHLPCPCLTWIPATWDGKRALMFGPYAGFKTNFLKAGSLLDCPVPAPEQHLPDEPRGPGQPGPGQYLVSSYSRTKEARLESLYQYYPG